MKVKDYSVLLPEIKPEQALPRRIYQTYKSKDRLPQELRDNIAQIKKMNPTWEYYLFDDQDIELFIKESYGEDIWKYYQCISPKYGAARADFFRYLLMYRQGGVYLDIKSTVTASLDSILLPDDKFILSHWDNEPGHKYEAFGRFPELQTILPRGEYLQWYIVSIAGHPFLRAVILRVMENIDSYHPWRDGVGLFGTLRTTGPLAYTLAIEACKKDVASNMWRFVDHPELLCLEYSIYDRGGDLRQHRNVIPSYHQNVSSIIVFKFSWYMQILEWGNRLLRVLEIVCDKWKQKKQI